MKFESLKDYVKEKKWPSFRVKQLNDAIFRQGISSWADATTLPVDIKTDLQNNYPILSFKTLKVLTSKTGPAAKALIELKDGLKIETVLIQPFEGHWSVCVSSQVGCAIGCAFCATGKMGFKRNLSAEEIADQALFWFQYLRKNKLGERISSIVFMGMGEPLLNYREVVMAAEMISNPDYLGIGHRHISISTAGIPVNIIKMTKDLPQANLAISLHVANDSERNKLVPVNRQYNLTELRKAVSQYIKRAGRQVFVEYTLIKGINSSPAHARELAKWILSDPDGYLLHVNIIPCNPHRHSSFGPDTAKALELFSKVLTEQNVKYTVRKSIGEDIMAACGQLAAENSR